jgi:hypothetical protein
MRMKPEMLVRGGSGSSWLNRAREQQGSRTRPHQTADRAANNLNACTFAVLLSYLPCPSSIDYLVRLPQRQGTMSLVPKTRLPMRIIALPLTSSLRGPGHTEKPSPLVYYHFQTPPKAENRRRGLVDWATGKAASIWAQFGKAPEGSWKVCNCRLRSRV